MRWLALLIALLALGGTTFVARDWVSVAIGTRQAAPGGPAIATSGTAFSLLGDNRLLAIRLRDGAVMADHQLMPAPPEAARREGHGYAGHVLAASRDGRLLYVLVTSQRADQPDQVVVVDAGTAVVRATHALPHSSVFRGLAVGPATGWLYLFGFRPPTSVIIAAVEPADGAIKQTWTAERATDFIYQGGISADERRLYIAYHNSGLDWYEIAGSELRHCSGEAMAWGGCIRAHGGFAPHGAGLLVATGEPVIVEIDQAGVMRHGYDTGLLGSHVADFAVDPTTGRLYAVGACDEGGGFSAVDLTGGGVLPAGLTAMPKVWPWVTRPKPPLAVVQRVPGDGSGATLCGERLALSPDGTLVVGRPGGGTEPAALLVVDAGTGRIVRTIPTSASPFDVRVMAPA